MVKTLELIQNYHSLDKLHQNPVKFYKQLALNLKVDINYDRRENIHFQYDKTAILYFDQSYAHKFIPIVLEIDFDSFYPQILMSLSDCDKGVLKMMNTLQKYRNKAKAQGDIPLEKTIKMLQNTYIGCCGSQKEYCRLVADMHLHSQIMKKSRDSIRKLKYLVEEKGFQCFFIQTDAIFCEIQNEEQGQILLELTKSIFPAKMKIHKQFYHWTQTHKYVSLVDNKPVFKSFAKNCEFFGQFVEKFIQTRNPEYLLQAYDHPQTSDNQSLISSLSKAIIQFPDILKFLEGRIMIRTDTIENGQIKRINQFVRTRDLVEFVEKANELHNGIVAFHEVIIHNDNLLVFDIDCKQKLDIEKLETDLKTFIIHHPIVKQFFNSSKIYTSYYQTEVKTSLHITFGQICLPLHIQKQLAIEAKQRISEYIDTQIYAIGKSLRLPECPNVKNGYTKDQMIQSTLKTDPYFRLQDYLFTKCNKVPIQNSFVTECLFKKHFSINYTFKLSVDHMETISQMMTQILKDKFLTIRYIELTRDNLGIIKLDDHDSPCIICKRKHDYKDNRTKLRFVVLLNDTVRISCFQQHLPEDEISIVIPSGSLTRTIQIKDIPLRDSIQINQRYILKEKGDVYNIQKYQCHIIKSSLGSGKSEVFAQQFSKFKRVLLISVRKCYTFANQKRFGLQDSQLYFHQGVIDGSAICQVESLIKVSNKVIYDLLIIDEFQSVLQQLYKPDKKQCLGYIEDFLRVIKQSDRMLICDANLEQSSIDWIINSNEMFEYMIIENIYQTFKGNDAIIYNEFNPTVALNYLKDKILNRFDMKQKSWIIVSQKNYQEDLARIIKLQRPELQLKIFNGNLDSIETDKINDPENTNRQLINNIEFFKNGDNFSQYDLILSNASITSGLDVPSTFGFDFVGGIVLTQQFNCQQLIQAIHRPRSVKQVEIFCQSLQTQRQKTTFFDHFLSGISKESHIDLHQIDEQLYSLCRQYTHDLSFLGIEYLYFWLQKMGYNLQIKTFQQQQEITTMYIGQTTILPKQISQDPYEILQRFMTFIPITEVQDPYLMKIQDIFQEQPKNNNQQIFNDLIELSRYQITAQYQSEGYDLYFEDKDWEVDPIQYTDLLKAYFNCGFNITWNRDEGDFDKMDNLFRFVVQYCSILKVKGKTFLKEFLEVIRINTRMRKDLEKFIQAPEFADKKERYKFYRLSLGCSYDSEKCVEKHIQRIKRDNLLDLNKEELLKIFEKSEYLKSRGDIATYLGCYSIVKQKKIEGKNCKIIELYDINYTPEAF